MSAHAYTEAPLVEQPAIGLFAELGWQVALPHPHLSFAPSPPAPLPGGEGGCRGRCGGGGMADKDVDTKGALGAGLASGIGWFHGETRAR